MDIAGSQVSAAPEPSLMRGLVVSGGALRYRTDLPAPTPPPGEALLRVLLAGICNTDLEIARGYMGFTGIPGHEFVAIVESAGDPEWIGKRVCGAINASCRECDFCVSGEGHHCPNRTVLGILGRDGAFADRTSLPVENLHVLPPQLPASHAIFVEPLAAAFRILEQIHIGAADRVLVLGDGKLGLLVTQVLACSSEQVTLLGRHPERERLARRMGFRFQLAERYEGPRADVVADCTGSAQGFEQAMRLTRPRGTLVLKSTVADATPLNLAPVVIDEIRVLGSRCGPFKPAIDALAAGSIDVGPLLQAVYPLEQGGAAFEHAARPGALKIALLVDPEAAGEIGMEGP